MAILNKDEVKGKIKQATGNIKDKAGELAGNKRLESEGEAENAEGHVQEAWGKTKRKASNVVRDVADAINKQLITKLSPPRPGAGFTAICFNSCTFR